MLPHAAQRLTLCDGAQDGGHLSPEPRASPPLPQSTSAQPTPEEQAAPETEEQPEDEEEGQPEQNTVMNFFKTLVRNPRRTCVFLDSSPSNSVIWFPEDEGT